MEVTKKKNNRAFTLLEVVVSTVIITVLAAGMFGAFVGAQYIFNRARHRMQAFNFAREAQDKMRSNYGYTDSQLETKKKKEKSHTESEIGTIIRGEMANLNTVLTYAVSEPETDGYKAVTVTVTWDETTL